MDQNEQNSQQSQPEPLPANRQRRQNAGGGICMVHDKGGGVGRANARLIAAAPALLAACEELLEHVEQQASSQMAGPWWFARRDQLRAALALAKPDAQELQEFLPKKGT